jgi:isopentenyl-diphosphate Delta-isomerase
MNTQIVTVNDKDEVIGASGKLDVHKKGILHRAFSVFVMNDNDELMLQQRAFDKYHSGGLWTNTCCSHGLPDRPLEEVIHEKLVHEMGFDCHVQKLFTFRYSAEFDNGLIENEIDHVYVGYYNSDPVPNPSEVHAWKWATLLDVKEMIHNEPDSFTYWFRNLIEPFAEMHSKG